MLSTIAGCASLGVGLVGWGAKAVTSKDASFKTKAAIGTAVTVAVSASTFAALTVVAPSNLVISNVELTMYSTMASHALGAAWAGASTALSYLLGGGRDGGAPQRRTTLGLR